MILQAVFVFGLSIVSIACYTAYSYYTARGDPLRSPLASGGIAITKGILVYMYAREPLLIVALAVGQVIGTWLTLRLIHRE